MNSEHMKAIVLFDTLFGNTERIANSLAKGLQEAGITTECTNIKMARLEKLPEYDLLALGHQPNTSRPQDL
jgi:menaquinone-dependent protoporphyrinogen IX oxidase